jgi:hypothetical protein
MTFVHVIRFNRHLLSLFMRQWGARHEGTLFFLDKKLTVGARNWVKSCKNVFFTWRWCMLIIKRLVFHRHRATAVLDYREACVSQGFLVAVLVLVKINFFCVDWVRLPFFPFRSLGWPWSSVTDLCWYTDLLLARVHLIRSSQFVLGLHVPLLCKWAKDEGE